ncbi:hypothetical protein GOP47_0005319 [Adiantum capillus-veneris]|uniref:Nitrate reductase n=1 Tax=Adiantum capillus-veneris TaxID=13818 RepID=A0A9D4ZP10_ADICA|nr:hypothetical protein GOP47_0005319 [Adiantum capillus-veneris]
MMTMMHTAALRDGVPPTHYHHVPLRSSKSLAADHEVVAASSMMKELAQLIFNEEEDIAAEFARFNSVTKVSDELHEDPDENPSDEDDENDDDDQEDWKYPETNFSDCGIDPRDEGTADKWIKRHPELVRLTGRHPFNSEPPLSCLMQHGFLTPTSLHYVRNHGYVPQAEYDEWRVEISGLVRRPQSFSMKQLVEEFTPRELPVTLACAGNRRKEQNMVKQSIGFNWGPAAISTSVWRGARLCDILRHCGVIQKRSKQHQELFVCFEGAEKLPGGGGSHYGTSIPLEMALDESRDVLVAYSQNGRQLEPDHGFPVRMIVPGFIGGRMVKWLTRIYVSDGESNSHYHVKDNRVLPSHVDAEKANAEDWWPRPDYLINELNINSVITSPAHGEVVQITMQTPYIVRGYAYSGGGRKVIRVEVTTDQGQSWQDARVIRTEKPTKYGKYWCWCFWELPIDVVDLLQAKELAVRAWDAAMNTQPQNLTWNVLGMMNNCWFRVKINICNLSSTSTIGLAFEHPTVPGNQTGGWMRPPASEAGSPAAGKAAESSLTKVAIGRSLSTPALSSHATARTISNAEFKQHNTPDSPWIVVHNSVYDCTKFLKDHPGGKDSILINAGCDCTEEFDAIHSSKAKAMLEDYKIGELGSFGSHVMSTDSTPDNSIHGGTQVLSHLTGHGVGNDHQNFHLATISEAVCTALDPRKKIPCKLIAKQVLSHDVRLFRFALPREDQAMGLPCGKHIFVMAKIDGKLCMRAYTPVTNDKEIGYFELLVKVYFKGTNGSFPRGGLMSQHLDALQIGDIVDAKGPLGHIHYLGKGTYQVDDKRCHMKACAMLAGGTGITPMYQLIREMLENPVDQTQIFLIFSNRKEEDIMLHQELDKWARNHPSRFKVWYILSSPPHTSWKYGTGRVNEQTIKAHFPPPSEELTVFLCGPSPMLKQACYPSLSKLGYSADRIFEF